MEYQHYAHNKQTILEATDILANDIFAMLNTGELSQKQIRPSSPINTSASQVLASLLGNQIDVRNMAVSLNHTSLNIQYEIKYNSITFFNNKWLVIDCMYDVGLDQ